MFIYLLLVDSLNCRNTTLYLTFKKKGIRLERVSNMQEAIRQCMSKPYMAVAINADSVDFKAQLQILRDAVYAPIHIFTSKINESDEETVYNSGADMYTLWREDPDKQVAFCIMCTQRHIQRLNEPKSPIIYVNYKCLRIYPDYRKAVINDEELRLNRKEYDILSLLLLNCGRPISYKQIYSHVWKDDYGDDCYDAILSQVQRLRKKLYANLELQGCIENEREFGYRLLPVFD